MRRICVLGTKRGAGKTSLIVNLGACLADLGKHVLVIDIDPEAGLDQALGARADTGTYEVLTGEAAPEDVVIEDWGMDLMLGMPDLAGFHGEPNTLRDRLRDIAYDYIFLDMPPTPGILTYNALSFAGEAFIVTEPDPIIRPALDRVMDSVRGLRRTYNPDLSVTGIILTRFDPEEDRHHEFMRELKADYGALVFTTTIRYSTDLIRTKDRPKPVIFYRSTGPSAEDYRALAREVEEGG